MFLTDEELVELTHRKRSAAQVRALRGMGIEHRQRPDGSVAVLRAHVERIFGGVGTADRQNKKNVFDFSKVND